MPKIQTICLLSGLLLCGLLSHAQLPATATTGLPHFPTRVFGKIQEEAAGLDKQLTRKTAKYLQHIARREQRIKKKLYRIDSAAARRLFPEPQQPYAALAQKLAGEKGDSAISLQGEYLPYTDTLRTGLSFLLHNQAMLDLAGAGRNKSIPLPAQLQSSVNALQALQAKMQDAGAAEEFIRSRKDQIRQCLSQYARLPAGLKKEYQGLNQDLYYYTQQVEQYKQVLNNPDRLTAKALSMLGGLPAFRQFMKDNSQLAGLFNIPAGYVNGQSLDGLQTRDQVEQAIRGQLASGGPAALSSVRQSLQSAQSQLDSYKNKLQQWGAGGGEIDMPFKPNNQKTKSFFKRLEYGTNIQTTRSSYYFPATTDLGLSLGYKLSDNKTIGIGTGYKIGWGQDIRHIALSGQGMQLRSFFDIKIKNSFWATGGMEYNYARPFHSLREIPAFDNWTRSGLIGLSKIVSVKSRAFKKTRLQLLWDFLSYRQAPRTQPLLFRVGYVF